MGLLRMWRWRCFRNATTWDPRMDPSRTFRVEATSGCDPTNGRDLRPSTWVDPHWGLPHRGPALRVVGDERERARVHEDHHRPAPFGWIRSDSGASFSPARNLASRYGRTEPHPSSPRSVSRRDFPESFASDAGSNLTWSQNAASRRAYTSSVIAEPGPTCAGQRARSLSSKMESRGGPGERRRGMGTGRQEWVRPIYGMGPGGFEPPTDRL